MLAKKIISMGVLMVFSMLTLLTQAASAKTMPAHSHFPKPASHVSKSKGNHRGSKHKVKRRKR